MVLLFSCYCHMIDNDVATKNPNESRHCGIVMRYSNINKVCLDWTYEIVSGIHIMCAARSMHI